MATQSIGLNPHRHVTSAVWLAGAALLAAAAMSGCGSALGIASAQHPKTSAPPSPRSGALNNAAPAQGSWNAPDPDIVLTCSDEALFLPNGPVTPGTTTSCGHITVGASAYDANCSNGAVPSALYPQVYDQNSGNLSPLGSVAGVAGGCQLSSSDSQVIASVGPYPENPLPGSAIVIVDFVPPASNTAQVAVVDVRCDQSAHCLSVLISENGQWMIEQGSTMLASGDFNNDQMPVPALAVGQPNRLLVWVSGDQGAAYINGRMLGAGSTSLPGAGSTVDFSAVPDGAFNGGAGGSAAVKLIRFQVFQAN